MILFSAWIVAFGSTFGLAQSRSSSETPNEVPFLPRGWSGEPPKIISPLTNWGRITQDIRLTIVMTNSVVERGSSITIVAIITNSSTNAIRLVETGPVTDFDLLLTNGERKLYQLTPRLNAIQMRLNVTINPGEKSAESVPVTFGNNIESGDYILKATRRFWIKADTFELESNLLKVQVK